MNDLGTALRAWRDRLDPAAAGLPRTSPRQVAGLRREELAVLAGISVEYVVRLEQGRAATPSAQVCAALARALQLGDDEQAHLLRLAGHAADPDRVPRLIPESLHRVLDELAHDPVAIYDACWQLLHWNPLHAAVFGDLSVLPAADRNALVMQFCDVPTRVRQTPAERVAFEGSLVADLRATTSRYPHDPAVAALVDRLRRVPRFRVLWESQSVAEHQSASKVVEHPDVGEIAVRSHVLAIGGSNLHVVVCTPQPGTDARGKLDLLAAIGATTIGATAIGTGAIGATATV
ncbi:MULTISPECIES: helix-turn-helix domain-containing protein [Catenuloplanes]|uniref:Transcriptional regulator with XRE-family HTH domain n=1 Tax=Catenuloplanes niger TaxID=587534 RepID=A0AAE4CQA4_9ACTN|nr:helix-turn-helix transcriptional regulator [Catenuloplanes niger]MDR7320292.1 transcriptional regulator with XRE-family HTH domain [Catenuloplanes niger]